MGCCAPDVVGPHTRTQSPGRNSTSTLSSFWSLYRRLVPRRVGMAVAAGLLSILCACRPCGGFFVRAYYVHVSHASPADLGLYFPLISCSFSFIIFRSFFLSFCSLLLSACCSAVGVTSRTTPTSPSFTSHITHRMCAFTYLLLSVLVVLTSVFLASSHDR